MVWLCPRCTHVEVCMIYDNLRKTGWSEIHNCIKFCNAEQLPVAFDNIEKHINFYAKNLDTNAQMLLFHAIRHEVKILIEGQRKEV